MSNIPEQIINNFLGSLENEVEREGMAECCRCVIAFLIDNGFIKACKIRAYMANRLYKEAIKKSKSKTQALNEVAAIMEIDEKQVRNIIGNYSKY